MKNDNTHEKTRKPSRFEQIAEVAQRHYSHQNSAVIHAKQELLLFEQAQVEVAIAHLTATLEAKKDRRDVIGATLAGLTVVLACR
ncbi:MAG: hypothetical protein ACHQX3_00510 [Nitrospirales bacterium]